jgi:hypothetical protein
MNMAGNGSSGGNGVAMVAIVVLVILAVLAGGYLLLGHGSSPTHSIAGSFQTPAGPVSGKAVTQ